MSHSLCMDGGDDKVKMTVPMIVHKISTASKERRNTCEIGDGIEINQHAGEQASGVAYTYSAACGLR
jgi:hypothetical protein